MAIDPNIALGVRPIEIASPLAQYGQVAQIQNAQNQNALAQYQLGAAQRQESTQNALSDAYKAAYNPQTGAIDNAMLMRGLAERGAGHLIPDVQTKMLTTQEKQGAIKKTAVETTGLEFKQRIDKATKAITDIAALNNPEEAMASIDQHLANGDIDQQKADMLKGQLTQAPSFGAWQKGMLVNILDAKERLTQTSPKPMQVTRADGSIIFLDQNPNSPTFQKEVMPAQATGMTPAQIATNKIAQQQANIAAGRLGVEQQRLAQDATSVVYQEDANGNIVALPSRLKAGEVPTGRTAVAPGGGFQPMLAKPSESVGKEQMSINQQRAIVKGALDAIGQTPDAFGYKEGLIPESARARLASPEENTNRSYLFNVVSGVIKERAGTAQSASEAQTLARFLPSETDNADIIKSKLEGFDKYLVDKEKGTTKKRAGPTNTNLAPMDQQALQWANSNPGDPRAAAIKQRLGM
jgi:hypothetical protein